MSVLKKKVIFGICIFYFEAFNIHVNIFSMIPGYVRFITNFGALNLELCCDLVPKTCENFMKHCQDGYYDGTKLHRSIRNFMVK